MTLTSFPRTGLLVALLVISIAGQAHAGLPPDAKEAINKGILAAKAHDYLLAIRYFQDARKIAPDAPEIYFDLGLAESKIPGRELRAIAWFGAYLAANPKATNAAAVKDQIDALDVKSQSNFSRVIKAAQDAADQTGYHRDFSLSGVPRLWAGAGDMTAALKTVDLIQDPKYKSPAQRSIAEGQLMRGNISGAQKTLDLMDEIDKSRARMEIAKAQAEVGDITSALKTADLIQNAIDRARTLVFIAEDQADGRDISGAKRTIAIALTIATSMKTDTPLDVGYKDGTLSDVAKAQAYVGDVAGARKTADLIQDADRKAWAQGSIDSSSQVPNPPVVQTIAASDWLKILDDDRQRDDCPLNTAPFLDLANYLTTHHSDVPNVFNTPASEWRFGELFQTAQTLVIAQTTIERMLKQQAKQKA